MMDELNEAMLKFAGFTKLGLSWCYPDNVLVRQKLPHFPSDLNACERWICPKLSFVGLFYYGPNNCEAEVFGKRDMPKIGARGKTLPMALCLAVSKMMEGK